MAKKLKCFLVKITSSSNQELTVIDGSGFTIGRSLDVDLAFASPQVSRTHLHVKAKNDKVWVEDPGSANGTFIKNERLQSGRFFEVGSKDVIRLGQSDISLTIELVDKAFDVGQLKKSNLDIEERTRALALVEAARAEAERLIKLGQTDYNRLLEEAKVAAAKLKQVEIEQEFEQRRQEISQQLGDLKSKLSKEAQNEKQKIIDEAKQSARALITEADANIQAQHQQAGEEAERLLRQAKEKSMQERSRLVEDAKDEIERLKRDSAEHIKSLRTDILESEKTLEQLEKEVKAKVQALKDLEIEHEDRVQKMVQKAESEIRDQQKKSMNDLKHHEELQNRQIETRRKKLEEEFERHRQLQESDLNTNRKKMELEIEKLRADASAEVRDKKRELDDYIQENQGKLKHLTTDVEKFKNEVQSLQEQKSKLGFSISTLTAEIQRKEDEKRHLHQEIEKLTSEEVRHSELVKNCKYEMEKIEKRFAEIKLRVEEMEEKKRDLEVNETQAIASSRQRVEEEILKLDKKRESLEKKMYDDQMLEMAELRHSMFDTLDKQKDKFARELTLQIEQHLSGIVDRASWPQVRETLEKSVKNQVIQNLAVEATAGQYEKFSVKHDIGQKRLKEKSTWIGVGVMWGVLILVGLQMAYKHVTEVNDPMKMAAEQKAKDRESDLQRRKFSPEQTEELKQSYVDRVIYTRNFSQVYLNSEFQKLWVQQATKYFLKSWRLNEEKTIEAISVVNALVRTLEEKKQEIHPDAIKEGISNMNELEAEAIHKVQDILGSEVRYEAFKKVEVKYFEKFRETLVERIPSAEESQK